VKTGLIVVAGARSHIQWWDQEFEEYVDRCKSALLQVIVSFPDWIAVFCPGVYDSDLGEGTYGLVVKARDITQDGVFVALKVCHKDDEASVASFAHQAGISDYIMRQDPTNNEYADAYPSLLL
jgi:hypothetical protein